jgi:hypothetical protein
MIFTMQVHRSPNTYSQLTLLPSLDIGTVLWQDFNEDPGITYDKLNDTFAADCAGLAVGCIIFIPFTLKYGRKPGYIISTIITFDRAVWKAKLNILGRCWLRKSSQACLELFVQMTVSLMEEISRNRVC